MAEYPRTLLDRRGHIYEVAGKNGEVGEHFLPYCHRTAALPKGWLMGTHQGAVSHEHLDYYLDEYTCRFNRRTSRHRGMLLYRLLQHAMETDSVKYGQLVEDVRGPLKKMIQYIVGSPLKEIPLFLFIAWDTAVQNNLIFQFVV